MKRKLKYLVFSNFFPCVDLTIKIRSIKVLLFHSAAMEDRFSYDRFQIYHSLALLCVYSSFPFYSFADQLSHEGGHTTIWNHILYSFLCGYCWCRRSKHGQIQLKEIRCYLKVGLVLSCAFCNYSAYIKLFYFPADQY